MHIRLFVALACALLIVRLPSLAQPMGADQGLYAYVGERILAGEFPYRHAWDQKPPAIHYTYAALRAIWPHDSMVAAADLAVALVIALLLVALGTALVGPTVGRVAALLFLLLSDPSFQRLAGVAARAQCETFIAAAVTGALVLVSAPARGRWATGAAGLLLGTAAAFKYNAILYVVPVVFALSIQPGLSPRSLLQLVSGTLIAPAALVLLLAAGGAGADLYYATVLYNVQYSGETYSGAGQFLGYLLTFPVRHARVDALWFLGGLGCATLLAAGWRQRSHWVAPTWVATACLTIAVNGSRGLPQYFVQALPALALAAAWGGSVVWSRRWRRNVVAVALLAFAVWRVNDFSRLVGNISHDVVYLTGRSPREMHLARYGDRGERKYSALAMAELATFIREHTTATDTIYVFGFASGAYVQSERPSASRFFWSRPVIVNFNAQVPGYGVDGLAADLERHRPALVALQLRDWWPDVQNSAEFFMSQEPLARWLRDGYEPTSGPAGFDIWIRRGAAP